LDDPVAVVTELVSRRLALGEWPKSAEDTPLADLGLDSLQLASLIVDLEASFKISFPAAMLSHDVFRTIRTVSAAVAALQQRGGGPAPDGVGSAVCDRLG
jgi:acyl carrier protein